MDGTTTAPAPEHAAAENRSKRQGRVEVSVAQIIDRAENTPAPFRAGLFASFLSGLCLWACFPPLDLGFLAWLAPLPWLMLIRLKKPTRWQSLSAWLGGMAFTIPALQWMRYGDPLMYIGWIALAFYVAAYIPVFIGLNRLAVHRWNLPLLVTAPVIWTGLEYLRGWMLTGFGWYYLGHTQYRWVELIQISDVTGAYGISFVMMLFTTAVALQIPERWFARLGLLPRTSANTDAPVLSMKRPFTGLVVASLLLASVVGYGYVRRSQAEFEVGPRVGLVQGDFKAALNIPASQYEEAFLVHNELTGYAVKHQPDVIVWPEGMFRYSLHSADPEMTPADLKQAAPFFPPEIWHRPEVRDVLSDLAEKSGAAMVIGLGAYEVTPDKLYQFNSAQLITPEEGLKNRYDKLHRVPFGEYIPGKESIPLIAAIVPEHFGLSAGRAAASFQHKDWTFAPIICFEDTVPHVTRRIVHSIESNKNGEAEVDFLVNLSNDGWFAGSSEHDQHLITAQFRAVEMRKPLVRAANMGISSFVDGDGVVLTPEVFLTKDAVSGQPRPESFRDPETGKYRRKLPAVAVHNLPLDNRSSLYLAWGDWFAIPCFAAVCLLLLSWFIPKKKPEATAA